MLDAMPLDARALAAAGALLALPGVLVVRSPWRAMPLLSLAFWVASWTWLGGASRTRAVYVALAAFAALAVFRLVRPGPLPRAGRGQGLIAATALLLAVPYALRGVPSGSRLPRAALTAELLAWHDGWPRSFEPLLPMRPFRADGLATLAADIALLSGAPFYRTAFLASILAGAVLLLALWSLAATRRAPGRAALIAVVGTLAATAAAAGPGRLAAAFAVEAVALWHDRRGNPSAFAAGACAAAAMATDVTTALGALVLAGAAFASGRETLAHPHSIGVATDRRRVALGTAVVLSVPLFFRTPRIDWPDVAPLVAIGVVAVLCARAGARSTRWILPAMVACAAAAGAITLTGAAEPAMTPDDLAALLWIRDHARPLDLVCAPDVPAARWIPAIAGRPAMVAMGPGWPVPAGECDVRISLSGLAPPGALPPEAPAFRAGQAVVWTGSQGR
ncbi:MAG TPA: hypothetical protein VFT38_17010 [Vicinamibacteria bacterium]|nr:hypothetical protein [Vicinamibacteria bacterium]